MYLRGLYLMTRWNMVMVCPPLSITIEELDEGIAILDKALAVADEFVAKPLRARLRLATSAAARASFRGLSHLGSTARRFVGNCTDISLRRLAAVVRE